MRDPAADGVLRGVGDAQERLARTEAKLADALRAAQHYRSIVETTSEGVWTIDEDGVTTFANARLERMLGYADGEMVGRPAAEVILDRALAPSAQSEVALRHRAGHEVWALVNWSEQVDAAGKRRGTLAMVSDISARKRAEDRLRSNEHQLQAIIDGTPALVVVRDLAFRFLRVNRAFEDIMGVQAADVLGRLDKSVLPPDALARVRMNDYRLIDGGEPVTHEEVIRHDGEERTFLSLKFLLADARGRPDSICTISTDITERKAREEELRERLRWEQRIRSSVSDGQLLVYSQPIMDLRSGELCQEELLVRMAGGRGDLDVVPPSEFLPQAERFGLITEIDRFMTAAAITLAARGRRIQVNISAGSIGDHRLLDEVGERLQETGADPSKVIFELTETVAIECPQDAQEFSARMAALGCGLALDDFGTGFGTFTGLRNLSVQYLKIDRSFVTSFATSAEDRHIVKSIVAIAAEFGLRTIAEGVEDEETLRLLREYGVDLAQGYFIGRPAPVEP